MVATPSTMLALGTEMPDFALTDVVSGDTVARDTFGDSMGIVVMFVCNHCPFVKHVLNELGRLARDYTPRDIAFVAISSNDVQAYPDDAPEKMRALERQLAYRGQLDSSRPGNDVPVTGADLRRALDAVIAGEKIPDEQMPSMGCNIKWKPGSAPEYFGG
jgi:thiol-disulfide isomerase/thioredoxin